MTMTSIGEMAMIGRLWPKSSLKGVDAVEASAIFAKDCGLRFWRELLDVIQHDLHHRLVRARERAHRPVGTDHETAPAKGRVGDVQVTVEVFGDPLIPFGLRYHGGELAGNVGVLGELVQILLPG